MSAQKAVIRVQFTIKEPFLEVHFMQCFMIPLLVSELVVEQSTSKLKTDVDFCLAFGLSISSLEL